MLRPLAALLAVLFWPIGSFREATTLCNAADKATQPGDLKSRAWRAALRGNVPPSEFGSYGLWRDGAPPPDSWLYMTESSLLTAHLTDRSAIDLTGDKAGFADFCSEHGSLAVLPTLAIYANGTAARPFETGHPPESDLVTKPVRGTHSKGFQAWAYADGSYACISDATDIQVAKDRFGQHIADQSRKFPKGLLVQPRLTSHPDLANLQEAGPPVARIITARWRDKRTEVIDAILQRPAPGRHLLVSGGMRLIDIQTGRTRDVPEGPHLFPAQINDCAFDNLTLPDWDRCLVELPRIHAAIPGQAPLLGWDLIFAPDGPTILEANTTIAPYFFQTAGQAPAADGKWAQVLAEYVL